MAEAVLIHAAEGILTGLLSLATKQINMNQITLAWGFKQDLKKLCKRLEKIQALLHDADKKEIASATLMGWLKDLKDATCDAENVLDELSYEALRRQVENKISNKVRDLVTFSDPLSFRVKMANKVNKINMLLDDIYKTANEIGLTPAKQISDAAVPRIFKMTRPCLGETKVVGRDDDVKKVVDLLLGNDGGCDLSVIAIVGMPGLGKTMVAKEIYKQPKVLEFFSDKGDNRMWVCVSDYFNIERLLNEMVESLTGDKSETKNGEGLVRKLKEKLNGKTYLLVLDDVWNTNSDLWVDMREALLEIGGSKGSKILVTTRSMEVTLAMGASLSCTHQLTPMSDNDCLTMFKTKAFGNGGLSETPRFLDIGRRLVEKCKGVPLAVNALGGLLYSKHDEHEWESIENSEIWSILAKKNGIQPILRLSVDHLPSSSLKSCFAYCSIFPKDQVIIKDELIELWMGLGYLQPSSESNEEMEELGNEYFVVLWRNSLIQEVEFDEYNNITSCKMHDLVHELALEISQGTCYTMIAGAVKINPNVQHLSLLYSGETRFDIPKENVKKLRTLFLKGDLPKNTKDFKRIHALCLENSELPTLKCCKSIHLRFLNISKSFIKKVPNFVTKLYNLETLKLPETIEELPKDFHKMVCLRHFYVEDRNRGDPILHRRLPYLKGKDEHRKLMPMKIGQLATLHTLPFFFVGKKSGHRIEELGSLSKLRGNLHVYDLQHVKDKEEAEKAQVLEKSNVQELQFHWDENLEESDNNHADVLEGLKPHRNVKGVVIINFGGRRWVSWMSRDARSLQNLVKIELIDCKLCEQIPMLGHLPHLGFVIISGLDNVKRIGPECYGQDEGIIDNCSSSEVAAVRVFPTLSEVTLHNMSQLEEWSDATSMIHSFPRLKNIYVRDCPKLTTIPGFKGSTSLEKLSMWSCMELTCFPKGILQPTLANICIDFCPKLKTLNPIDEPFNCSTSLQRLVIFSCAELMCLPKGLLQPALVEIRIENCPKLKTLNPVDETEEPFNCSTSLQRLEIYRCAELMCLPRGLLQPALVEIRIENCPKLKTLNPVDETEEPFNCSTSLQRLEIYRCAELMCLPKGLLQPALVTMEIAYCDKLKTLNPVDETEEPFNCSTSLQRLEIRCCAELMCLPKGLLQPALVEIRIENCPKLKTLNPVDETEEPFNCSTSLQRLQIRCCAELMCLPKGLLQPALVEIEIWNCPKLKTLNPVDETEDSSTSLKALQISFCPELMCLPSKGLLQPNLVSLELRGCPKLKAPHPDALRSLTSLEQLMIQDCPNWGSCWEEGLVCTASIRYLEVCGFGEEYTYFPWPSTSAASEPWCHFTSLKCLTLEGWPEVKSLPDQLEHLPALRILQILSFSGLESLPDWLGNLSSLRSLKIHHCPLLERRCEKGSGEDWCKIAHIPLIEIDDRTIQDLR